MKHKRLLLALVAALLAAVILAGCSTPQEVDPEKYLQDAAALVKKAEAEKSSSVAEKDYRKAIQKYTAVVGQFKDRPEGAQARYELGVVYQTARKPVKDSTAAYTEFNTLIDRYDRGRAELSQRGYTREEIDRVLDLVAKGKVHREQAGRDQDRFNATHPLWGIIPLYQIMDGLVRMTGKIPAFSYWFAVIVVTVIVKLLITPLTKAQFKAMKEMQKISPLVKEIQTKYKGDQQAIGQKTMDLYKEHGINPFASCLPMLIQMPILLLLYTMIRSYQFQFENGHFFWIGSGLKHMYDVVLPFGGGGSVWVTAANLAEPDLILVVLYVISMYVSTKLSSVDPTQAEQQKMMAILMPVMFAFLFAGFPSAFLLYWLVFNVIQTVQQYLILNKHGEPLPVTGPAAPPVPEKPEGETPRRPRRRRRR